MSLPRPAHQRRWPLFVSISPTAVVVAAPAKLNLFLEVLGRRPDGYHELATLMVAVDWCDTVELSQGRDHGWTFTCEPAGSAPSGQDNLAWRAACLLAERTGVETAGLALRLVKRLPAQAGLGGGSSDAAAVLLGLNQLWKLALTNDALVAMGSAVGSDVPFFLTAPAAWCTGRGEVVTEENMVRPLHFVLVCPPVGLSTARVYAALQVPAQPRTDIALRTAWRSSDVDELGRHLFNRLEEPAFHLEPLLERLHRRLTQVSPFGARLSGSGSALFALCRSRREAVQVAEAFLRQRPGNEPPSRVLVVRTVAP
ncbi:MAG: 4-(cytidine 5'-diphospho)-2-C-methyl-D-erythritol kinase [Gemmataceae bacterium]|nr:4-(cytidine 5'-diphospho)-2-C-methyl-D-erythritol kinase [Gemmataceae bacterium]MCS7270465.1 4-(cytidine 5'-diphospho)-2-C-methyl-D-erythritol kinase [Gemmataceae bacterium]MDW8242719.1 4-(cytidine 5'-diphospho)-2-C-methyl-D-erythritol kinase [Thermogemmata sp.]